MRLRDLLELKAARDEFLGVEAAGEPSRLVDRIGVGRPAMTKAAIIQARSRGCAHFGLLD